MGSFPRWFATLALEQRVHHEALLHAYQLGHKDARDEMTRAAKEFTPEIQRWYSDDRVKSVDELSRVVSAAIDALRHLRQPGARQYDSPEYLTAMEMSVQAIYGLDQLLHSISECVAGQVTCAEGG